MTRTTVLIVNFNTSDFIALSLLALERLTRHPYKVCIMDNGSRNSEYQKIKKICAAYPNVQLIRRETSLRGSAAHGSALDLLTQEVDTPYFAVLDADAAFLIKDWDDRLMRELDREHPVIGTQAPPSKPRDFPLMFAILFRTREFRKLKPSFLPKEIAAGQDTGHELRERYLAAGYEGKLLKMKNTRQYKKGPFRDVICAEYYLPGERRIFASHFGRGAISGEHKYRKGTFIIYRVPVAGKIFRVLKGKRQKRRWISIARRIIEEQE